ncbi:hypothetical Protein YC6258_03116 [Gynuella sunshinyii YC6258]|uniref:Uncharacterized protein n=1 Tax=Gynuella sunshinyii YC6258 TaxID=1445510 RepID=A0A0C5VKD7_9GAMM|nr:hypothetical Protein YC6258_03116 [Gynuella sunshinyii YC6258]
MKLPGQKRQFRSKIFCGVANLCALCRLLQSIFSMPGYEFQVDSNEIKTRS